MLTTLILLTLILTTTFDINNVAQNNDNLNIHNYAKASMTRDHLKIIFVYQCHLSLNHKAIIAQTLEII
jgi:hypothetical protein